ncbi:hypothetical protein PG985_003216 [Apiospora marii]|uniref:uncharacterized protein n=1 Tax=Apiospora marii TaxID=335849 RepID=UPI0031321AC5
MRSVHLLFALAVAVQSSPVGAPSLPPPPPPPGYSTLPGPPSPPGPPGPSGQDVLSSFGVPGRNRTFDYVVVGGGTAGLTLATRLVEQKAGTVAVVEAGTFYEISNGNLSQLPANDYLFGGKNKDDWQPGIDWGYISEPQKASSLWSPIQNNAPMHYARGKCFGGSSARHYMAYQRPNKGALQMWADAVADKSYEFDRFVPYYERSIKFSPPRSDLRAANATPDYDERLARRNNAARGSTGVSVTFPNYAQAFTTWAVLGLKAIGLDAAKGSFLDGRLSGQAYALTTIQPNGVRESSETAFLRPTLQNPDYTVYRQAMAKRILFDGQKRATGVVVDTGGLEYTLAANKEVIVSGGFIGSPQLLQASGVGPADLLKKHGVPVVADRPGVGQNLQDHVFLAITYRVNAPTISSLQDPVFAAKQAALFHENGSGMYSNPITEILAWEKVPEPLRSGLSKATRDELAKYPADWPEIEYISSAAYVGVQDDTRPSGKPFDGVNYASLAVVLSTPRSRGSVNITSANTGDHPALNPNFLVDPVDIELTLAGFKRARQFWQSDPLAKFRIGDEAYPGLATKSDDEIRAAIRKSYNTIFHGSSTCRMGQANDPNAVVDSEAKVIGVQGLRVVDASAFPFLPPGHPQSTVYALAEKISCKISRKC